MIVFRQKGNFSKTEKMLQEKSINIKKIKKYADLGIEALMSNTPKDTGLTASSWYYTIEKDNISKRLDRNNEMQNKKMESQ